MLYAVGTKVKIERTVKQIERLARAFFYEPGASIQIDNGLVEAAVTIKRPGRSTRIAVQLPEMPPSGAPAQRVRNYDAEVRRRYRVLYLSVKTRLAASEAKVSEDEVDPQMPLPFGGLNPFVTPRPSPNPQACLICGQTGCLCS